MNRLDLAKNCWGCAKYFECEDAKELFDDEGNTDTGSTSKDIVCNNFESTI
jgi:hypothetical protein